MIDFSLVDEFVLRITEESNYRIKDITVIDVYGKDDNADLYIVLQITYQSECMKIENVVYKLTIEDDEVIDETEICISFNSVEDLLDLFVEMHSNAHSVLFNHWYMYYHIFSLFV